MDNGLEYTYAVAKVRAMEGKLLSGARLERLVAANTVDECLKLLAEDGYPIESGYEEMLSEQLRSTYEFLRGVSPEKQTFDIFLLKNDYHNLKAILKAEFLGRSPEGILTDGGRFSPEYLRKAVAERSFSGLPDEMREAVIHALARYDQTGDPQETGLILDRAAYREMGRLAEGSGSAFVQKLVAVMTDLENIRIFQRVHWMGRDFRFLQAALLPGGTIGESAFLADTKLTIGDIIGVTQYQEIETGDITSLEKSTDNFLLDYVRRARFVAFGIEPLVAYLVSRENEIKLIRIILTGKRNNVPAEEIRERLRDTYV